MITIAVCIKQVPSEIDAQSCMNMYDYAAIETALRMKEGMGGSVDVFTMGPLGAQEILKEALAFGADRAVLLSDSAFAGADVLATAYTLSCGIRHAGAYDVILCGQKSTNGDTAQVGGELAMELGVTYVPDICKWSVVGENELCAVYLAEGKKMTVKTGLPVLLSVAPDISGIRIPTLAERLKSSKKEICCWNAADIQADIKKTGQTGSATKVIKMAQIVSCHPTELLELSATEAIQHIRDGVALWAK